MIKENEDCPEPEAGDEIAVAEATAWFVRLRTGEAGEVERRAFRAWLERDPLHRRAYAEAEALWQSLGRIPDPRSGGGARQDAPPNGTGFKAHDPSPAARDAATLRRLPRRGALAFAASVMLLALLGLWGAPGGVDRLLADHATGMGESREVTLADGSTAHLNTDTAVSLDFTATCRCVELMRGEAFFAIAEESKRPFRVIKGPVHAEAKGTAFNIQERGEEVTVAVAAGEVRVTHERANGGEREAVTLGPGEAARVRPSGGIERHKGYGQSWCMGSGGGLFLGGHLEKLRARGESR